MKSGTNLMCMCKAEAFGKSLTAVAWKKIGTKDNWHKAKLITYIQLQ